MKHFRTVGVLDVGPFVEAVAEHAALFGQEDWREKTPGSPQSDTETIYLRMPKEINFESVFHSTEVASRSLLQDRRLAWPVGQICRLAYDAYCARVMIVKLKPGGHIPEHVDEGKYSEATNRYHWAVSTNGQAWLKSGGEQVHVPEGVVVWFDKHAPHEAWNAGDTDRTHLIVDTFR